MKKTIENIFTGAVPLVGRVLLGILFLLSGINKIGGWEQTAGFMGSVGMPMVPLFLAGAIAVEVLGGLSLILGVQARAGASALFLFMIPTTLLFHAFWNMSGPEAHMQQLMFMKNLSIMGGLAMTAAWGSGRYSLDRLPCPFKAARQS